MKTTSNKEYNPQTTDIKPNNYWDSYEYGQTKETLTIGQEVGKQKTKSGTIDTSDSTLQKVNNGFVLTVPNPNGKIFSIGIDGLSKLIKIDTYGTTADAYANLQTQLRAWLGLDYTITYTSGTSITMSRLDGQDIVLTHPNVIKQVSINNWSSLAKLDIIIDGTTYTGLGSSYTNGYDFLSYINTQLSTSVYASKIESSYLIIGKYNLSAPTITSTEYDKYTYLASWLNSVTGATQIPDYTINTIGGLTYKYYDLVTSNIYEGYKALDNLITTTRRYLLSDADLITDLSNTTSLLGQNFTSNVPELLTTVEIGEYCTATRSVLKQGTTTLATSNFSAGVATFNYQLTAGVEYFIGADSNGSSYNYKLGYQSSNNDGYITNTAYNSGGFGGVCTISYINTGPLFPTLYSYSSSRITSTPGTSTVTFYKSDYSQITLGTQLLYFEDLTSSGYTSVAESNNRATITVGSYTEITITSALSTYNLFIPVGMNIKKIEMTATSSVGRSDNGVRSYEGQSCTSKYGTTTEFVTDKIFKTDGSNSGYIAGLFAGGFTINFTTNTSNKLDYICS